MEKEQIKEWITNYLTQHPQVAEDYNKEKLANLQTQLKFNERIYDRKGQIDYKNQGVADKITLIHKEIEEIESQSLEGYFVDKFIENYQAPINYTESQLNFIANFTEEDCYIEGVFKDSKYWIRCKKDFDYKVSLDDKEAKEEVKEIKKIYKKGLPFSKDFIDKGVKSFQELKLQWTNELQHYNDIDATGPEVIEVMIANEVKGKNLYAKELASMSVVDAFDAIGNPPTKKEMEKIEKIVELHDTSIVESAIKTLTENPTNNMKALIDYINTNAEKSSKDSKWQKFLDYVSVVGGAILIGAGITFLINGEGFHWYLPIGIADFGIGVSGILKRNRKTGDNKVKSSLMAACFEDLLKEVELQEALYKGLER